MPEALDAAFDTINFVFENAKQLLQANVSALEKLNFCVFAYFNREEVFYLNQSGRKLLTPYQSPIEDLSSEARFTLESNLQVSWDDRDVIESCRPKHHVREVISLSWGNTWLRGSKYPIRAANGIPIAILFAGREMLGSEQIRNASLQQQYFQNPIAVQ